MEFVFVPHDLCSAVGQLHERFSELLITVRFRRHDAVDDLPELVDLIPQIVHQLLEVGTEELALQLVGRMVQLETEQLVEAFHGSLVGHLDLLTTGWIASSGTIVAPLYTKVKCYINFSCPLIPPCLRPRSVMTRPRGVRSRKPI
ncbi:MAG: hypothetical protein RLY47_224 [Candidatus Parcubacteria bacterium]